MSDLIERLKAELAAVQDNRWGAAPVSITQHEAREIITALTPQSEGRERRDAEAVISELCSAHLNLDTDGESWQVMHEAIDAAAAALRQPAPPTWTRVKDGQLPRGTAGVTRAKAIAWHQNGITYIQPITPPEGES